MRLQFWITRKNEDQAGEEVLASWVEYGNGPQLHRNTQMTVYDTKADNKQVNYYLRVSKLGSVGTMALGQRTLSAILLPRL